MGERMTMAPKRLAVASSRTAMRIAPRAATRAGAAGLVLMGFVAVTLAACGGVDGGTTSAATKQAPTPASSADRSYAIEMLGHRAEGLRLKTYETYAGVMPNHVYSRAGRKFAMSDSAVSGRIVGVHKGSGFFVSDQDAARGTAIPYDDSRSLWRTIHLDIAVDHQLGGKAVPSTVVAGLVVQDMRADFDRIATGLEGLEVVAPLTSTSKVFSYDPSVHEIAQSGELLAVVDSAGELSLPFLGSEDEGEDIIGGTTLADLERDAARPTEIATPAGLM